MQKAALKANDASNTDLEVLLELNRNYVRSALESDVRWYAENLSEDFYITAPDGVLLNREAFLKRIANPYPGTHAEPVDVMVRILGDVANHPFRLQGYEAQRRTVLWTLHGHLRAAERPMALCRCAFHALSVPTKRRLASPSVRQPHTTPCAHATGARQHGHSFYQPIISSFPRM